MKFTIVSHDRKQTWQCDSRSNAEERVKSVKSMLSDPSAVEIVKGNYDDYESYAAGAIDNADDGDVDPEVIDHTTDGGQVTAQKAETERKPQQAEPTDDPDVILRENPIEYLRGINSEFVNTIKGTPAISKRGFRFIQVHLGVSTTSEVVATFEEPRGVIIHARAELPDGRYAEAHGEGYAKGDVDSHEFARYADTRAKNRALSDLTSSGALAESELE